MYFELLAETQNAITAGGINPARWHWLDHASRLRSGVRTPQELTTQRSRFLITHALDLQGVTQAEALEDPKKAKGSAKSMPCETHQLSQAGLLTSAPSLEYLPEHSASITLRFQLLTPLLTRDDDAFYLFDNPVRKDPIFGVPYVAASSIKGLAADAFQRGFPAENWSELGDNDQIRTQCYRRDNTVAKRLFGLASDDMEAFPSEGGRLHCSPVWFSYVQFLVMNPTKDDGSGIGSHPIQFEAIAPTNAQGRPVEADLHLLYFNPAGAPDSDITTVHHDIALLIGALATWWPTLGLGAKRLAGYGAIKPLSAQCQFKGAAQSTRLSGEDSWMKLAQRIAAGSV